MIKPRPRRPFHAFARALMPLALVMSGCGLHPLYDSGGKGVVARSLHDIQVMPIAGTDGWHVHNALIQQIGEQKGDVRYRLEVELDDQIESSGIRRDETVVRERRILRARYRLIENASGTVVIDATAGADSGIDVVSSDYATMAAEATALEHLSGQVANQIVTRVAAYVRQAPANDAAR